ncbi:MAG: hypothetical protein V1689_13610, partial [Pseudomonadota bacterium]
FCQAGERALHRDILLWGCCVTRFKTSLPFFEMMPSFTSFGKKTLAVLYLSSKRLKCYAVSLTDGWMEIIRQTCRQPGLHLSRAMSEGRGK